MRKKKRRWSRLRRKMLNKRIKEEQLEKFLLNIHQ